MEPFTVAIGDDEVVEEDQTFTVMLSGISPVDLNIASSAVTATAIATITITDDDSATITVVDADGFVDAFPFVYEDDGMVEIRMRLEDLVEVEGDFEVTVSTEDGTAIAGSDYTSTTMTLTFAGNRAAGTQMFTVPVSILNDGVVEYLEFFSVDLSDFTTTANVVVDGPVSVEIEDEDTAELTFSPRSVTVDESVGTVTVTAMLDNVAQDSFEVEVETSPDTATSGDYALTSTTLTFPEMAREVEFTVSITDDRIVEDTELFTVSLADFSTAPEGIEASDAATTTTITITDDDDPPLRLVSVTLDTGQGEEGTPSTSVAENSGTPTVTVTAELAGPPTAGALTVSVSIADSTARAGVDYTATPSTFDIIFQPGVPGVPGVTVSTGTFMLTVIDDMLLEGDESITVTARLEGSIPDGFVTEIRILNLTITDNDALTGMELSLSPADADEGASPTPTVTVMFDLADGVTLQDATVVTVTVGDSGDSATEGTDYTAVTDFTFPVEAGESHGEGTFTFEVTDDTIADPGETVTVVGRVGRFTPIPTATLAINDNDPVPTEIALSLSPADADEGTSPTVTVTATLSGTVSLEEDTVVTVAVGDGTGSATEGTDYTEVSDFTVTIPATTLTGTRTFQFAAADDAIVDPDETVTVSGTADGFTIPSTSLTITDTDTAPTVIVLSLSPDVAVEGATTPVTVTATLSGTITLEEDTVVTVTVGDGKIRPPKGRTTPRSRISRSPSPGGRDTFGTGTFQFETTDDAVTDNGETVTVSGTATDFTIDPLTLTITEDDVAPTAVVLSLSEGDVAEGASPTVTVTAVFDPPGAVLGVATTMTVTVGDSEDTATEVRDYTPVPRFAVTIAAGATDGTATFQFTPADDAIVDPDETVTVSVTATGFTIDPLTLTITDTDTAPTTMTLSITPARAPEGLTTTVTVTATLSPASITLGADTEVRIAVLPFSPTATAGTDFTAVPAFTLTIPAEMTSGTASFDLVVADDADVDPDEMLSVFAFADGFSSIRDARLTIIDTDSPPTAITLSLSQPSVAEGASAPTVTVTAAFPQGVTALTDGPW